jgi:hypothetical protein
VGNISPQERKARKDYLKFLFSAISACGELLFFFDQIGRLRPEAALLAKLQKSSNEISLRQAAEYHVFRI